MSGTATRYLRTIKTALFGDATTPLVFLCNFEAERYWAANHVGLPGPTLSASVNIVARMEELGVLLAGPDDHLILKQPVDPGYLAHLRGLGVALPNILTPERVEPGRSTTEDVLDSPALLGTLAALGRSGALLMPMGTTVHEEKLAAECGLPLAVPGADTFERVNGKDYGRRIAAEAGLRMIPGQECHTVDELADALRDCESTVVVKEAYGVSGKGLIVIDEPRKAERLLAMSRRRALRSGSERMDVVVETWLPKRFDLNYQVTIGRDGSVTLDFVKQALTESGVHKGHLIPAELSPENLADIATAAQAIGARLYADGFVGIAGIDAILDAHGTVYPVLEINARLNMSTYQGGITELLYRPDQVALARHYPLRLARPVTFAEVKDVLGPLLDAGPDGQLVPTCFGTLNANAGDASFDGRLYTLLIAPDRTRLDRLDARAQQRLARLDLRTEQR